MRRRTIRFQEDRCPNTDVVLTRTYTHKEVPDLGVCHFEMRPTYKDKPGAVRDPAKPNPSDGHELVSMELWWQHPKTDPAWHHLTKAVGGGAKSKCEAWLWLWLDNKGCRMIAPNPKTSPRQYKALDKLSKAAGRMAKAAVKKAAQASEDPAHGTQIAHPALGPIMPTGKGNGHGGKREGAGRPFKYQEVLGRIGDKLMNLDGSQLVRLKDVSDDLFEDVVEYLKVRI